MILVTGGTGLLGSHLLYRLISSGKIVRALKRKSSNLDFTRSIFSLYSHNFDELFNRIEWFDGDITDIFSLEEAFNGIDYVYHCAAVVSFDSADNDLLLTVNSVGTANIVNMALEKKITKFCHVSSIAALGRTANSEIITENSGWVTSKQNSYYAISKFNAEREVWRGINEGLNAVIINPSVILGPGDWTNDSSKIFSLVENGLLFYTNGVNAYTDVEDVVSSLIILMESDISSERYIIASENYSYRDLLNSIAIHLNKKLPRYHANRFLCELAWRAEKIKTLFTGSKPMITKHIARTAANKSYYSNKKFCNQFNYEFISVDESIKRICNILLKQKSQ